MSGEIMVDGTKSNWSITISGQRFPLQRQAGRLTSQQLNNVGRFRATIAGPNALIAFWVQAPNDLEQNEYATPIALKQVRPNLWRGTLHPLETRLSLWLSIQRAMDGSLTAVIRNPELNLFHRVAYRAELSGAAASFVNMKNAGERFEAKLRDLTEPTARALDVTGLANFPEPLQFQMAKPGEALGFVPRIGDSDRFQYTKPVKANDGWNTASLQEVGLKEEPIAALIQKICRADPINNPVPIHSLLVARHGKLVLEEYFYGFSAEPHTMRSASKTFAPLLAGIARDRGAKVNLETPVYGQFPEYKTFANPDPRKSKITVRDLMTMSSGLACDDNDEQSPGNEDVMQQQKAELDWYKYTLDLPIAHDPGGDQAIYCSAGINLLGGIVRNVTQSWLPEYFHKNVAKPLQIDLYHWNLMPNGDGYAGGGLWLRARDQLKLGQLYLNGGVWNGKRIISRDWVAKSTSRQTTFGQTLGVQHDYGYGWHLYHCEVNGRSYAAYAAGGNGGQIVMVIPDLDMVVGFTGGAYGEFPKWYKWQTELVPQFIIPAAVSTNLP